MAEQFPKPDADAEENRFLLEQPSFFGGLVANIKDFIRPQKQPELVLESKPIPVKSIWTEQKSGRSQLTAFLIHAAVIGVLLLPFWRPVRIQIKKVVDTQIFVPAAPVAAMPRMRRLAGGGSPIHVQAPKLITTPKPIHVAAPSTIVPNMNAMPMPSFGSIGPISGPPGAGGGSGTGPGGTGSGSGGGTCTGPNCGDTVGSGPVAIYSPDPQYSDAARKAKFQGTCIVQVTISADGRVSHPVIIQPLGLGLDQKAIQAVLSWRFLPAKDKNGRPIAVTARVELNFHLY
jgi:protein TonB